MAGPFALWADVKTLLAGKVAKPLNTAADGQVLTADTSSSVGVSWKTPAAGGGSGTAPDATSGTKGLVALAGDLAGTADVPTLKQINAQSVTVGDSNSIPRVTIDTAGRVTQATEIDLSVQPGSIAGLNEYIQDLIAATVSSGTGITTYYDDAAGRITIAATGGGTGGSAAEPGTVALRRQADDGSYSSAPTTNADTVLWYVGTTPPDSSSPTLEDDSLFSLLDGSN